MRFFLYGLFVYSVIALATESVFTGIGDQIRRAWKRQPIDPLFPCRSFLWAVPVYALPAALSFAFIDAFAPAFYAARWPIRASTYAVGIFCWEFLWGYFIEKAAGTCPWQYRVSPHRVWRYIFPPYAPLWAMFGFVLEWTHRRLIPLLDSIFPSLNA